MSTTLKRRLQRLEQAAGKGKRTSSLSDYATDGGVVFAMRNAKRG